MKHIIIHTIIQEMRLHQFTRAMNNLGVYVCAHEPDLLPIIAGLMNIKTNNITDEWIEFYVSLINRCEDMPIELQGKNLHVLAEDCYEQLKNFSKI
jgi:hypothetical protein